MNYVYERGKGRRVMHIEKTDMAGNSTMKSLCGTKLPFDTTINAPFALGKKVCKNCLKILNENRGGK